MHTCSIHAIMTVLISEVYELSRCSHLHRTPYANISLHAFYMLYYDHNVLRYAHILQFCQMPYTYTIPFTFHPVAGLYFENICVQIGIHLDYVRI